MTGCGIKKASKALVPLFLLTLTFYAISSFATSGVLIFSSWDTQEKATTDAERISGLLEQKATTMQATVKDRKVYRVIVAVETDEDRSALVQTAEGKDLKPWFLSTARLAETEEASDAQNSTPDTDATGGSTSGDQKVVLIVDNPDPEEVLNYLDQATIDSTLAKLDAVRKRAQELIPDFVPRMKELPPVDTVPKMPQAEQDEESEEQPETSSATEQ
ncbi:MAG: hypothetical protein F4077_05440 [Gammaproteobacteria bacterium]|nr:hypothetical protein [Gammaproteobacteria bacterium]MYI77191.1 hypothetical protein [Gammaproteobacteria bacterium]